VLPVILIWKEKLILCNWYPKPHWHCTNYTYTSASCQSVNGKDVCGWSAVVQEGRVWFLKCLWSGC